VNANMFQFVNGAWGEGVAKSKGVSAPDCVTAGYSAR
jgi:hypothetical protein